MTRKTVIIASLAALATTSAFADPSISKSAPGIHTEKAVSMVPHPGKKGRRTYGAPIPRPIAGRVQPKKKSQ
ncbi:MAG TPA: hypothetical protein VGM84_27005 [Steroidobacteraceae bacterium]|jgi:hypothetical protein